MQNTSKPPPQPPAPILAMLQPWTKYGELPKKIQNKSAPKLTDSSELSELAHRNFWLVIETTRCAFPSRPVCLLSLIGRDLEYTGVKSSAHTHTHTHTHHWGGCVVSVFPDTQPRPTYPDSREWCCMPGPENCGGIDMLFIISFCINYISQNGKRGEEKWEKGQRQPSLCYVPIKTYWICCALSQFSLREGITNLG